MDLGYYWQLLRRRLPMIVILTTIGSALGIGLALTLPPTYEARALLVVESEQIPGELAASTVRTGEIEALQIIRQRILSREVLLELANRFEIYGDDDDLSADQKVSDLRERISIDTRAGQTRRGPRQATIVTVGFSAGTGRLAANTANEIVTLILQENVEMRTSVARQTLDFFNQEVDRLEQDLSTVSSQILDFQENNLESLPDSLEFRRAQQASLQGRLIQLEREQTALQDRRAQMVTLFETTGRTEFNTRSVGAQRPLRQVLRPEEVALNELRAEYGRLAAILSESNPRMAVMRSQITAAERAVANLPALGPVDEGLSEEEQRRSVEMSLFDIQLADVDAQISYIVDQKATVNEQLERLSETIVATPGNAVTLAALERSYENLQTQYNQAVSNKARAETGSIIESLSRGQRITVVEQAVAPQSPASPNRPMISVAGFSGGLALGLVIFILLEALNRSVRRPQDLQTALGIDAFGTVPYMNTDWEHFRRRTVTLTVSAALLIGITGGLWYVDNNVRPLQPIMESVLSRLNLNQLL